MDPRPGGRCAGAPQKIAYLAAERAGDGRDHHRDREGEPERWRRHGMLDRMRLIMALPTAAMFSQPDRGKVLKRVAAGYGIEVRHNTMRPRYDMYLLKRYALPQLYWHDLLRGRA